MGNFKFRNRRFRTSKSTSRSVFGGIFSSITTFFTMAAINDLRKENGLIKRAIKKLTKAKNKAMRRRVITPDYKVYDMKNEDKK